MAEEEGAGGGIVERVVGGTAGDEGVEGGLESECGDEALQCVARQGGVGLTDEAEGVDPEGIAGEGREAGEDGALGGDVVGDGDGGGEEGMRRDQTSSASGAAAMAARLARCSPGACLEKG